MHTTGRVQQFLGIEQILKKINILNCEETWLIECRVNEKKIYNFNFHIS